MGNNVQELIDMLSGMIREARSVPLSNDKCMIERDRVLDLIDTIKAQLPTEMAEAKRLVEARAEFIANAKREAETVRHAAEERAKQMVNEQEIFRSAQAKSEKMLADAEKNSSAVKQAASEYVGQLLAQTEEAISASLSKVRQSRDAFTKVLGAVQKPAEAEKTAGAFESSEEDE